MLRYRYTLTKEGLRRCINNEFYLQKTPRYRGYTEKIFRILHSSDKPLTIKEISELTGIHRRSVNGVITFNIMAGYIRREPISGIY
jgi:Mn-dependent DtxR family transcriptional regulator